MERLTSRNEDCVLVNGHALGYATKCEFVQMAERLAAYEDTGMSPKGCAQAAEANRLMEAFGLPVERIVELLKEEIHGRRITLPCVPGDTLWLSQMFYTRPKKPVPVTVDALRIDREGTTYITGRGRFFEDAIGRTVFLTEEEAKRAMEGKKDG